MEKYICKSVSSSWETCHRLGTNPYCRGDSWSTTKARNKWTLCLLHLWLLQTALLLMTRNEDSDDDEQDEEIVA
jgi:hypothetical protein